MTTTNNKIYKSRSIFTTAISFDAVVTVKVIIITFIIIIITFIIIIIIIPFL